MFCLFFAPGPIVDLASAQAKRSENIRAIFSRLLGARRLFRAVAI